MANTFIACITTGPWEAHKIVDALVQNLGKEFLHKDITFLYKNL